MPTAHPRYAVTDTGATREMLDAAQRHWPEVTDRKELLLQLAAAGREALADNAAVVDRATMRAAQMDALGRARELVDRDVLLGEVAWQ